MPQASHRYGKPFIASVILAARYQPMNSKASESLIRVKRVPGQSVSSTKKGKDWTLLDTASASG